jgi:hypothetical protein
MRKSRSDLMRDNADSKRFRKLTDFDLAVCLFARLRLGHCPMGCRPCSRSLLARKSSQNRPSYMEKSSRKYHCLHPNIKWPMAFFFERQHRRCLSAAVVPTVDLCCQRNEVYSHITDAFARAGKKCCCFAHYYHYYKKQ